MKMKSWLSAAGACALALAITGNNAMAADAKKGKEVFEQCSACHDVETNEKKMGPALKGLYKKGKLHNGKPVTDANVQAIVDAGGNGMPPYADILSAAEKADLIAYLKTV
ncbi:MAG: cytochrome c [Acidobacteria bacterium]|nr:cytochrome c [Acidobacteriota bacterium]